MNNPPPKGPPARVNGIRIELDGGKYTYLQDDAGGRGRYLYRDSKGPGG